jgi:hypothetical protein
VGDDFDRLSDDALLSCRSAMLGLAQLFADDR